VSCYGAVISRTGRAIHIDYGRIYNRYGIKIRTTGMIQVAASPVIKKDVATGKERVALVSVNSNKPQSKKSN
jgi:hypothetical protein